MLTTNGNQLRLLALLDRPAIWPVGRMLKMLIFQAVTYSDHERGDHLITSSAREQLSRMSSKPAV
jgi:hypothetical protein